MRTGKEKPKISEVIMPSHVQRALIIYSNGSTCKVAAESVGIDYRILRKYV